VSREAERPTARAIVSTLIGRERFRFMYATAASTYRFPERSEPASRAGLSKAKTVRTARTSAEATVRCSSENPRLITSKASSKRPIVSDSVIGAIMKGARVRGRRRATRSP
jgi:hypothetical protein